MQVETFQWQIRRRKHFNMFNFIELAGTLKAILGF